ncbi:MAG: TIGR00730 family Rossman fold protein [Planctomycetota bacterium]
MERPTPGPLRFCVFCGSSTGAGTRYRDLAAETGRTLAEAGIGVVYGGANRGLMGILADAALEAGGEVHGVLPYGLQKLEVAHEGLTSLEIVDTLHERKARMMELSRGFIALPGGHGTLEELFEVLTWLQLEIHRWPVGVVNLDGFYDGVVAHLDRASSEGFIRPEHRELLLVEDRLDGLVERMRSFARAPGDGWETRVRP